MTDQRNTPEPSPNAPKADERPATGPDRKARIPRKPPGWTEERHGTATLARMNVGVMRAEGCTLPDGTRTNARSIRPLPNLAEVSPEERADPANYVWRRVLPGGGNLARRGRVYLDPGVGLRFVDQPDAGEGVRLPRKPNLEHDLGASPAVREKAASPIFAEVLYAALCNTEWRHRATGERWSCSWRSVGAIVAHLSGGGDYLDWYGSGGEGLVDERVLDVIQALGWDLVDEANES